MPRVLPARVAAEAPAEVVVALAGVASEAEAAEDLRVR